MAGFAASGLGTLGKAGVSSSLPKPPKIGQPLKVAGASVGKIGTGGFAYAGAPASATKIPTPPKPAAKPNPLGSGPGTGPTTVNNSAPSTAAPSSGGSSAVAPLDATAIANIAAYIAKTNNSINTLGTVQTNPDGTLQGITGNALTDQSTYATNLAALQHQNPLADLKLLTANNDKGGLYSSSYGQQLGNLNQQYQTKEGTLATNLQTALGAIANKIAGLNAGIPLYENTQGADSAARLAKIATTAPVPAPAAGVPANAAPAVSSPNVPSVAATPRQPVVNTTATAKAAKTGTKRQQAGFRVVG